jgi:hypothetical protein
MSYVVVAGYVTVETAVPGGRANVDIPRGRHLPDDVPAEQVETELRLGRVEEQPEPPDPAADPTEPPPQRGRGSGLGAWTAYAHAWGVAVPAEWTRDKVIEELAGRGIPVE